MVDKNEIGAKIKNLRESREITKEELSKETNVSLELINSIESGDVVPSLTPITKIAKALGVRLGTFLDDAPQNGPLIVKNGETNSVVYFSGEENQTDVSALEFHSLGAGKNDRNMEPFIIDVHTENGEFNLSSHEGEEFIYVLEGEIEVKYGQDSFIVSKGDSIYYDSIIPHHLHSYNGEISKILAVVYTPF
ncbi:DNA-binding protein [Methanobrevibacter arboriphilus]|jgi:transcriptional regulator with XRE-family HTH domain|uniref:DNA-binding protein n=1 Tax=Methanobrevibacter arboriphilus TaxID=39441 RepID=A0ACA8R1R4_METAZ|nr:XRE family transcriptional regulator [Methanobrevibacter arboriphilus]MCC7562507.1 XRE family transcriptional regulator [Methanobrevibacter arboriphilus]BBL61233.1 DNA-binding protein [Methanobrevibacter arboriphilus]GLI11434.1 DNA-binding protein [Methanobrevibacter arboriphilus]